MCPTFAISDNIAPTRVRTWLDMDRQAQSITLGAHAGPGFEEIVNVYDLVLRHV